MLIYAHTGDSPFAKYARFDANNDGTGDNNENAADEAAVKAAAAAEAKTKEQTDLEALIAQAVETAVTGLKKKNEEVIGTNKKLKDELTALKGKPVLSEEEFTEFQTLKGRIERDEMLKLMAEGKSEEVIARVTQRTRLELEAKLATEAEVRAAKEVEANTWRSKYEQTLVSVEVAKATAAAVKPAYQELVMKLATERVKLVDGAVRIVNDEGEIEMNAAGNKPLTVSDYIETLRNTYSDLFVVSTGGGAGGSGKKSATVGVGNGGKISMEDAANLPQHEYMKLRAEGRIA